MRVLVINNLVSGLQDGAIHDYVRKLCHNADEIVIRSSNTRTNAEGLLHDAESFDVVVASGGDATVSTVCYSLRGSNVPILPFPAGTGNLVATNLRSPDEPLVLAQMTREGVTQHYDLGEIDYFSEGRTQRAGFAVMAGAGYDARIMAHSEKLKGVLGPLAYIASAITDPLPTVAHFTITLDDEVLEMDGIAVLVINFAQIFPDIAITHANDARDGAFEVVVVKSHNAVELLPAVFAAFLDRGGGFPGRFDALEVRLSRTVCVESDPPLAIQYDGEAVDAVTPFVARALPHAVRFIVTREQYERHAR
ncbi:MAG: hypothetical protein LBD25_03180 [Coriobacteriales bacterium]|nr:hypothetical protein [Coriobacteriales bacterium]